MINYTATYTDLYQLTMALVYFKKGQKDNKAVFDYFFRQLPFNNGYAVFAGLADLLAVLEDLHFDEKDLKFLREQGFDKEFIRYLEGFRFSGSIYSCSEGELVFPGCPILQVEGNIVEAQLVETILLNILNFQTLIATKASRIRWAAGSSLLLDFGLRRAQGPGGYYATRAAVIGGFDATSNVRTGRDYDIPVSGTMAHSYIQSYDEELEAFRHFAEERPDDCILLVDTYDTLKSGVPNAIKLAKEMEQRGDRLKGIRLDSGDLAFLAKKSREMLDREGLEYVKIAASNKLDEFVIKSLKDQQAPIDVFGVGTSLVTGSPDAALDGVYKLAYANDKPRIKLSETITKITLPHKKQVFRILDERDNFFGADAVALADETEIPVMYHPFEPGKSLSLVNFRKEPLFKKVMENGRRISGTTPLKDIAGYRRERLKRLPEEFKRFYNPHIYKVGLSDGVREVRDNLLKKYR